MARHSKRSAADRLHYRTAREKLKREAALAERETRRLKAETPDEDDSPYFDMDSIDRPPPPEYQLQSCINLEKSYTMHCMVKEYIEGYEPFDDRMGIAVLEFGMAVMEKVTKAGPEMWAALDCATELKAVHAYLFAENTHIPIPGWASARLIKDCQNWMDKPDWAEDMLILLENYTSGKWVA